MAQLQSIPFYLGDISAAYIGPTIEAKNYEQLSLHIVNPGTLSIMVRVQMSNVPKVSRSGNQVARDDGLNSLDWDTQARFTLMPNNSQVVSFTNLAALAFRFVIEDPRGTAANVRIFVGVR